MPRLILLAVIAFGLMCAPAHAQQQPSGLPDILGDIFGGGTQIPTPQAPGMIYIENIPVQVTFDTRPDLLAPESTLVLTAIAPPPANIRRAKPLVMGETRILISRLAPPLSLVIAVPSDMARDLDYAQIDAKIVDTNGNVTFRLDSSAQYSGGPPPFLELIPAGAFQGAPGNPAQPGNMPAYTPPQIEVIKASVDIAPGAPLMRGSVLVLQVTENDLAGGFGPSIIHEQRVNIDQKQAPFSAVLNVPTGADGVLEQPELVAYIEDWAGRKTFVRSQPVAVPGSGEVYTKLDPMLTGQNALPPGSPPIDFVAPAEPISGTVEFDAFKGLPSGSVLSVTLRDAFDVSKISEQRDIPLDGLSGYIDFTLATGGAGLAQFNPPAVLSAQITDSSGRTLFSTPSAREAVAGNNIIRMTPNIGY